MVAVLVVAFSGVGVGAREAEPGDRLWTLTKVLFTEDGRCIYTPVETHADLVPTYEVLAQGGVGEVQIDLAPVQGEWHEVNDGEVVTIPSRMPRC